MNHRLNKKTLLSLMLATLALSACSKDKSDLYQFIEQTKNINVGSVKPIPQFEPYESFTYSAGELRDPFIANAELDEEQDVVTDSLRPDQRRPRQPLESFPLDTLAMVGILEQRDNQWALIKDPQNIVHRVQLGNYMGRNEGRVTSITESDIRLIEIVPDGIGGYIEREAAIAIGNE
jgi:type IV pilus assembly protein PilP